MFALAMAVALTSASLLAVFVAPLERVYRHGYEAGLREQLPEPQALPRAVGQSGVVIPLRPVRLMRSDN